jgi:hypothetical protein
LIYGIVLSFGTLETHEFWRNVSSLSRHPEESSLLALILPLGVLKNCFSHRKSLLYSFTRIVIKLTFVIIEACCFQAPDISIVIATGYRPDGRGSRNKNLFNRDNFQSEKALLARSASPVIFSINLFVERVSCKFIVHCNRHER